MIAVISAQWSECVSNGRHRIKVNRSFSTNRKYLKKNPLFQKFARARIFLYLKIFKTLCMFKWDVQWQAEVRAPIFHPLLAPSSFEWLSRFLLRLAVDFVSVTRSRFCRNLRPKFVGEISNLRESEIPPCFHFLNCQSLRYRYCGGTSSKTSLPLPLSIGSSTVDSGHRGSGHFECLPGGLLQSRASNMFT